MVFFTSRGAASTETAVGDLDVGRIFLINENNIPTNYLVVNQGIPGNSNLYDGSCNGTWCLRQNAAYNSDWWTSSGNNNWPTSEVQQELDQNWVSRYDENISSVIKQVKIPYTEGNRNSTIHSGANGYLCKVFMLSGREYGVSQSGSYTIPNDSVKLDYFLSGNESSANQKRVAKLNGVSVEHYTRSCNPSNKTSGFSVRADGSVQTQDLYVDAGIRPCIILPFDFIISNDLIVA